MSKQQVTGIAVKREGLKESLAGNELFIYSQAGEELLVLNRMALFVWSLCDDHDETETLDVLAELYPDADRERLKSDILESLALFEDRGLLEA